MEQTIQQILKLYLYRSDFSDGRENCPVIYENVMKITPGHIKYLYKLFNFIYRVSHGIVLKLNDWFSPP